MGDVYIFDSLSLIEITKNFNVEKCLFNVLPRSHSVIHGPKQMTRSVYKISIIILQRETRSLL